jgi:hypothetical protein
MTDQPQRERPPRKPRFRRNEAWVAVKPIRLGPGTFLSPGDEVPDTFRLHHLRHLWRRNAIGPKGSDYVAFMLGFLARNQDRKKAADAPEIAEAARAHGHEGSVGEQIEVESTGGGWYRVLKGGDEVAKLQGTDAVNAWLEEHGFEAAL